MVDYIRPTKNSIDSFTHPGQRKATKLYDSTAPDSASKLELAFANSLTPKSIPWFNFRIPESSRFFQFADEPAVQNFTNAITNGVFFMLAGSNFYNVMNEVYDDYVTFHTSCLYSEKRLNRGFVGMNFRSLPIKSYVFAEDDQGLADTLFREFDQSARQIAQTYDENMIPSKVKKAIDKEPDKTFTILRGVLPREEYDPLKRDKFNMPWALVDILQEEESIIDEGGFEEFPYHIGRYDKASGEIRGRGPSTIALGDIKSLNELRKEELTGLKLAVKPPILAQDKNFVGTVRMKSNAISYAKDITQVKTMPTELRLDLSSLKAEQLRQAIRDVYLTDQIVIPTSKQMTAEEVATLREQVEAVLGPTVERIQEEKLKPSIERTMGIGFREGLFPPIPDELEGLEELDIDFTGPLARGQKLEEVRSSRRWIGVLTELSTIEPSVMDNVDLDEFARWSGPVQGVPERLQRSEDDVEAIREQRQQQQERDRLVAEGSAVAEAGGKVAPLVKAVSEAGDADAA